MPINEITAASYSIAHYVTDDTNEPHVARLYFDEVPTLVSEEVGYRFAGYTDAEHLSGWTLAEIWDAVYFRMNATFGGNALQQATFGDVEVWQSVPDEPNLFLGLDPASYEDISAGAATGIAAAYLMLVMKSASRQQFRFTIFDATDSKPQRYAGTSIPEVDNDTLQWLMARSAIGFVTQDNEPLTIASSYNTGYNRKLARSYGRVKTP